MSATFGGQPLNEFYATLSKNVEPRNTGNVRLTTHIRYGQGYGIRFIDISVEEAEALGVELIQAAQLAHDAKARRDAENDRQVALTVARAFPNGTTAEAEAS